MAAELPNVIDEELLCCPLCMRSLKEPRMLPCLHTFCRTCLDKHLVIEEAPFGETTHLQFANTGIITKPNTVTGNKVGVNNNKSIFTPPTPAINSKRFDKLKENAPLPFPDNNQNIIIGKTSGTGPTKQNAIGDNIDSGSLEYGDIYEDVDPESPNVDPDQNFYEEPKELEIYESSSSGDESSIIPDEGQSTPKQKISKTTSVGKFVNLFLKKLPKRKISIGSEAPLTPQTSPSKPIIQSPSSPDKPIIRSSSSPDMESKKEAPTLPRRTYPKPLLPKKPALLPRSEIIIENLKKENSQIDHFLKAPEISRESSYSAPLENEYDLDESSFPPVWKSTRSKRNDVHSVSLSADDMTIESIYYSTLPGEEHLQDGDYLTPTSISSSLERSSENSSRVCENTNNTRNENNKSIPSPRQTPKPLPRQKKDEIDFTPASILVSKEIPKPSEEAEESPKNQWSNCPTCDLAFQLPSSGIKGIKSNSFASSLQEVVMTQNNETKKCSNCNREAANFRCLDCRHYLCGGCRDAHNWLKITKHHRVMTLGELRSGKFQKELTQLRDIKCEVHKNNKVDLMCLFCDMPICYECKINEHLDHRCGSLEEAAERDKDLMKSLVDMVQQSKVKFEAAKSRLEDYDKQCNSEKQELLQSLNHQKEKLINLINECHLDLVQEIERAYKQELDEKEGACFRINGNISHMKYSCDFTNSLLTHGKIEDILLMSKMFKTNLNNLVLSVPYELDTRPYVHFSPTDFNPQTIVPLFGSLARRKHSVAQPKKRPIQKRCLSMIEDKSMDKEINLLFSFRAKSPQDSHGCKPTGLTISTNDYIILVDDINKKMKVYDPEGGLCLEISPSGNSALIDPWDVTITKQGHLAVTDKGSRKVKVFDSDGTLISEFGDHLKSPWGIAANSAGNLIVSDIVVKTVFVNDPLGKLLYPIVCKGEDQLFMCPEYIAVNHNDDIIVSDFEKHCLTVFDAQGRFLYKYGEKGSGSQELNVPVGTCVDKEGCVLVVDYQNRKIHKISRDGQFLRFLLTAEHGLNAPQSVAVNSLGHIVVADGGYVKVFGVNTPEQITAEQELEDDSIYEPLPLDIDTYGGDTYGGNTTVSLSRAITDSEA